MKPNFSLARNLRGRETSGGTGRSLHAKIIRAVKYPAMGINTCRWPPVVFYIICEERPWRRTAGKTGRETARVPFPRSALEKESPHREKD